jgi:hypothetical protein
VKQGDYVALANVGLDFILGHQRRADFVDRPRRGNQFPNTRGDFVEPVIKTALEIEDRGFTGQIARDIAVARDDDRVSRKL